MLTFMTISYCSLDGITNQPPCCPDAIDRFLPCEPDISANLTASGKLDVTASGFLAVVIVTTSLLSNRRLSGIFSLSPANCGLTKILAKFQRLTTDRSPSNLAGVVGNRANGNREPSLRNRWQNLLC